MLPHIDEWKVEYVKEHPDAEPFGFYRAVHARLRRKIREISEPNESGQPIADAKLSPSQKKAAEDIHKFMMKDQQKGMDLERFIASPPILKYMKKFKRLMDTSSRAELDYLTAKYKGFYDFALLMEEFAIAIRDGTITPPEAYENVPLLSVLRLSGLPETGNRLKKKW